MLRSLIVILLILVFNGIHAQTVIRGVVRSSKGLKPLKGVNMMLKDTYDGGITDDKGFYLFTTSEKGEIFLQADLNGFMPGEQKISIGNDTITVNFTLKKLINELDAVTISAGSFEANDKKRATVLKPLDIVTTAGANGDITGALQTLPGAQRVGEQEGLFIRGGSAEESKIIIDGTVVNNFFFSSVPGIAQRGRFSPFLFNSTAFSTGGYSAQYGQALSAVLNLESVDLPDRSEAQAGVSPIFANAGFQKLSKNKKFSYGTSYSYSNLTLYLLAVPTKQEFFKAPEGHNVDLNFRRKFKKGMLKFYGYFNYSGLRIRSASLDSVGLKSMFGLSNSNTFTNLSWKQNLKNRWKWYSVASFSYDEDRIRSEMQNSLNEPLPYTGIAQFDNSAFTLRSYESMAQIRSMMEKKFNGLTALRFGGEFWHNRDISNLRFTYFNLDPRISENYSAAFVEADVYLSDKLAFRPGVRYEYSELLAKSNLAPRASVSYLLAKPTQLSFDYGIFYQTPDRKYLYNTSAFDFARADHYILTFQHLTKDYTLRSQVFYKKYLNLIKTDAGNQYAVSNDGRGYAQGFEVFWRDRKTFKGIDYWVSYSFLDTKRDYLNYPIYTQPGFAASHNGSLVIKKFWDKKMFGINWSFNWATGRPYYNPNLPAEEFLSDRTPFYSNNNFSFNWITRILKASGVVVVGVNNVFNQKQVFGYTYSNMLKDETGQFIREELGPPARMSFFVGMFLSWGVDRTQNNINNNL